METSFNPFKEAVHTLSRNRVQIVIVSLCFLFVLLFLYLFYMLPSKDMGPEQPIPFSHRVHAGVKQIHCEFCHPYVSRSRYPGIPPVEKCLYCHKYVIANHPWIKKEHQYFNTNTSTPWVKANYIPEHVFFNHQRHIKKNIACEACHGEIKTMDRIKGVHFEMGFCIECHREKKANLDCWLACHN